MRAQDLKILGVTAEPDFETWRTAKLQEVIGAGLFIAMDMAGGSDKHDIMELPYTKKVEDFLQVLKTSMFKTRVSQRHV